MEARTVPAEAAVEPLKLIFLVKSYISTNVFEMT
jgi:hypothetical protein